jgi:hypothetical protein
VSLEAKLAADSATWATFHFERNKHMRLEHVAKVYHLKSQNTMGANLVGEWMSRHCRVEAIEDKGFNSGRDQVWRSYLPTKYHMLRVHVVV